MKHEIILGFLMLAAVPAMADRISLKSGDIVSGQIMNTDEKTITFKTEWAGEIKIDRGAVATIQTDQAVNVTAKDVGTVKGTVRSSPDSVAVTKPDGTVATIDPGALLAIRNDAAQRAWEREEERLNHPRLTDFWAGFTSLGIANASGNASTTTISTAASATRVAGKNKIGVNFAQIYSRQSTTLPFGETANRISGGVRIDRDITPKFFVLGFNSYDYDKFLNLDLRMVVGGGFGYHVWKSPRGYFDVASGINWNRETFDVTVPGGPYLTQTRNSTELFVSEEAAYQPFGRLKLFERLTVFPNLSDAGEFRMNLDTTASVPIKTWLEWNFGFSGRYLTNPLPGFKKLDTILTMGIRATFDQTRK